MIKDLKSESQFDIGNTMGLKSARHLCGLPESGGRHCDAGSAACHSGREHMHGAGSAERRGVICTPLRGGAECAGASAPVSAGWGGGAGAVGAGVSRGAGG